MTLEAVLRDPFAGIGKPEPLKYLGANVWSRRLSQEHRLVYLVSAEGAVARLDFPHAVATPQQLRTVLKRLAERARSAHSMGARRLGSMARGSHRKAIGSAHA
jgi:hypothetical protein